MLSTSLVSVGLSDIRTISQGNLGGRGRCALRVDRESIQAAVNSECAVVLDGRIQSNMAAAGGLGGSVAVARQCAFLQGSNTLTRSLVSTHTCGGPNLDCPNTGESLACVCFTSMPFTWVKPFLTSSRSHVFTQYSGKNL